VDGSGISTVTNAQGSYSLTLPANAQQLNFSLIGYIPQTRFISGSVLNVVLQENQAILNDVVRVTVAEAKGSDEEHGVDIADLEEHQVLVAEPKAMLKIRGTASLGVPKQQVEKQISVDFDIKTPYTVKSDNNVVSVDMDVLSLPATFQYYCAPKLNKEVYLTALLQDWEKYNFLEGEANVFFEDTYVGKTILDVNAATDTLSLSLGRDKKVSVQRDKVKGFTAKQFIGSKKEETRIWKTTVRNNRKEAINLLLLDQVPVSQNEEIEVTVQASDGGKQTPETGEIKWETKLDPGKTQSFDLKYVVKYPKNKFLIIE
ncbi:MAG: mucoidy inhibitor MuiA family protein, partial [Bacteroidota bacterium]|nr:mucoidy inhibitor MuiA family protein [Bacteroidota bacterium]